RLQARFSCELEQECFGARIDQVLGEIGEDAGRRLAQDFEALRVGGKGPAQGELFPARLVVRLELGPGGRLIATRALHEASMSFSSLTASAAKARIPSASFS